MSEQDSLSAQPKGSPQRIDPRPARIYHSNGIIFELYDGGRPYRRTMVRWEHLESLEGLKSLPEFHRRLLEDRP